MVRPILPTAAARQAPRRGSAVLASWSLGDAAVDTAAAAAVVATGIFDAGERLLEGVRLNTEGGVAAAVFLNTETDGGGAAGGTKARHRRRPKSATVGGREGEQEATMGGGAGNRNDCDDDENEGKVLMCGLLMCGDTPNADPDVFRAANNSGLVYDGRLVVDSMFRTSDPAVLAGGTLTKFSRVHGADALRHEKYNAREVISLRLFKMLISRCW